MLEKREFLKVVSVLLWLGGSWMSSGCEVVPKGVQKGEETEETPRAAACEAGKERNEDTAGQCCWKAQAWSKIAGKCIGVPQCPPSYKASGEDCSAPGSVPADYVRIPSGSFTMGSTSSEAFDQEKIVHRVRISRGFFMKKTEVTQGEWRSVMGSNPSDCDRECSDDRPVNNVSWEDSLRYLNKLSEREGLEPCYAQEGRSWRWVKGLECEGYRLPTEAEWEYAARGGTTGDRYGSLDSIAWYGGYGEPVWTKTAKAYGLDDMLGNVWEWTWDTYVAWYDGNSGGKTKPVGTKTANAYGLYDMLGNVWEWTWDAYGAYSSGDQEDPIGGGLEQQDTSASRVLRGGSWLDIARNCRAANRFGFWSRTFDSNLGLRPARSDR